MAINPPILQLIFLQTLALWLLLPAQGFSQLVFRVYPPAQNSNTALYIASNRNGWNPSDTLWQLQPASDGTYSLEVNIATGPIEFKVTGGGWDKAEGTVEGRSIPNRKTMYKGDRNVLDVVISGWEKAQESQLSTKSKNVHLFEDSLYISNLQRYRRVWAYLPASYHQSDRRYPVIYLLDGQNVFDRATSYAGEWQVDETLDSLFSKGAQEGIVIAVENAGKERLNEYSPWVHPEYGGGQAQFFIDWLVNELKPRVDSVYRTKAEAAFTGIAGSSMGGLVSFYAWCRYPDIFGHAGVFSPSFWFSEEVFRLAETIPSGPPQRVYLLAGKGEGARMCQDAERMNDILAKKNFPSSSLYYRIDEAGQHNEAFWAREMPGFWRWFTEKPE